MAGIGGDRYDLVVIDAPPLAERAGIVLSALRLADLKVDFALGELASWTGIGGKRARGQR